MTSCVEAVPFSGSVGGERNSKKGGNFEDPRRITRSNFENPRKISRGNFEDPRMVSRVDFEDPREDLARYPRPKKL